MGFSVFTITDANSSGMQIQVYPTWGFEEQRTVRNTTTQSITGKLFTYRASASRGYNYTLPLTYVPASDKQQIDEWWRAGTALKFTLSDSDGTPESLEVKISNHIEPLGLRAQHETALWEGSLKLRSYRGNDNKDTTLFLFTLDNNSLGVLGKLTVGLG